MGSLTSDVHQMSLTSDEDVCPICGWSDGMFCPAWMEWAPELKEKQHHEVVSSPNTWIYSRTALGG